MGHAGQERTIQGIVLFLCSLAPIAFFSPLVVRQSAKGTSYGFNLQQAGHLPPGDWEGERQWLVAELRAFGFDVPNREELIEPLPSEPGLQVGYWGLAQANLFF